MEQQPTAWIEWAQFGLDVLRVFLGWPVVVGVVVLVSGHHFKDEIRAFMANIGAVKTRWAEVELRQNLVQSDEEHTPPSTEEFEKQIKAARTDAEAARSETEQQTILSAKLEEAAERAQDQARTWWLRYLEAKLPARVKESLRWISDKGSVDRVVFDVFFDPSDAGPLLRGSTFLVLSHEGLIAESDAQVRLTDAGRAFLSYQREQELNRKHGLLGLQQGLFNRAKEAEEG